MAGDEASKGGLLSNNVGCTVKCGAEPQGCEAQFKQRNERKADTMKTYILKPVPPVEPQRPQSLQDPPPPPPWPNASSPGSQPRSWSRLIPYIGLDMHNDSIAVSLSPSNSTRRYGIIGGRPHLARNKLEGGSVMGNAQVGKDPIRLVC